MSVLKSKLFWICAVLFVLASATSVFAYNRAKSYAINEFDQSFAAPIALPTRAPNTTPGAVSAQDDILNTSVQPWTGKERVNVLLMGIDQRQGETDPGYRTDTMIVLTLDPVTLSAGMLSVPRDLWVEIKGFGFNRINTANQFGDAYKYPGGGGPELARQTVQTVLGIPIHFYGRVNFTAFEDLIDRVGGVSVDVPKDIYDTDYPTENFGTEVFSITKGIHNLDGVTALKYARTRHGNNDFDRARRQQQIILAVREKLKNPQILAGLAAQAPDIIANLSQSVKTNMSVDQMMQLAALAQKVDLKNIKSAVLDDNYTELALTQTDPPQAVQIPIRNKIAELKTSFFSAPVNSAPEVVNNPSSVAAAVAPDWKREGARIAVLNGTLTAGLAQRVADTLKDQGFDVVRVGNAPGNKFDYAITQVTDYTGKSATVHALEDALKVPNANEQRVLNPTAPEDIVLILGADYK
jgi:LCP family protein required for cell wall assembly